MNSFWLVALPLLSAFLLPQIYRVNEKLGYWFLPAILTVDFLLTLEIWWHVVQEGAYSFALGGFPAPLGIVFYVDQFALLFISLILLGTLIVSLGRQVDDERTDVLTLWLVAAGCGLMLSGDLFNIYVFYEILAIASYGLVGSYGRPSSYAAGIRYLILGSLGSSLALLGIALVYATVGTLNLSHLAVVGPEALNSPIGLTAFVLMLIGFGVKAELFPINTWVSEVYTTTSIRVTALLAGIVSKLALVVILRLLLLMYGETDASVLLLTLGMLGVFTGELAAFRASYFRQVLAYSSIAQLGLVAIAFSIATPLGIIAGIALALHHAVVKSALFLLASQWQGHLNRLVGAAQQSRWGTVLFLILVLSLVGVPPLPGFWAKFLLIQAAFDTGETVYYLAIALVMIATMVETAYFMRIARLMFQVSEEAHCPPIEKAEFIPVTVFTGLIILATVTISPLEAGLDKVAKETASRERYITETQPAWGSYRVEDFR